MYNTKKSGYAMHFFEISSLYEVILEFLIWGEVRQSHKKLKIKTICKVPHLGVLVSETKAHPLLSGGSSADVWRGLIQ